MSPRFALLLVIATACRSTSNGIPDGPQIPLPDAPTGQTDAAADASGASVQIAAARAAPDGAATLPIDGAYVTYVAPPIGTDPVGFFIQHDQVGPALFIAVDPTTLTPVPAVGDMVSLEITDMTTVDMERRADMISGLTVISSGYLVGELVQDLTTQDIVTNLSSLDSVFMTLDGTLTSNFTSSGTAHVEATMTTTGDPTGTMIGFRLPTTIQTAADLASACVVHIGPTPLGQFNTKAEPSAWVTADLTVTSCPAPKVVSAVATAATTVLVTFDRVLDPATVTADGSQFTFDQGLTATAAVASGKQVTLTTSAEAAVTYTLTTAATIKDIYGSAVDASALTTTFVGFQLLAGVVINEVDPNIGGSKDLVELLATSAGSLNGIKLVQDIATPVTLATLPNLTVAAGDLIVVHLNPAATVTNETATKADCTDAGCYAGAWDVVGGTTGITFSNRILRLINPDTTVADAVALVKANSTSPVTFPADLQVLQAAALWLPADCGGALCTYTSTPIASDPTVSVDWSTTSTTATGTSVQRKSGAQTKTAADWSATTQTFGLPNL